MRQLEERVRSRQISEALEKQKEYYSQNDAFLAPTVSTSKSKEGGSLAAIAPVRVAELDDFFDD